MMKKTQTKYEKDVHYFLSAFRFLSYALAVLFMQVPFVLTKPEMPEAQIYIIVTILGIYTALKVLSPLHWREKKFMSYVILIGDFLISIFLVLSTRGLNSIFLLYSLNPVITAALFFEEKISISLAAISSLFLSAHYINLSRISEANIWMMQGYNTTLLIIYVLFCFFCATIPYRVNLNLRRRIEQEAIIEERIRLGREIHDSLAQSLVYLNLKIEQVKDKVFTKNTEQALDGLQEVHKILQDTYGDVRESIDQLSSKEKDLPLKQALGAYIRKFSADSGIKTIFYVSRDLPQLAPVAELQLLGIAQEALTNVRKHSLATEAIVKLDNDVKQVDMVIKDNGKGFNLSDLGKSPLYHGLNIMKDRAEELGGNMTISTAPGSGTEVKVSIPIDNVKL